MDADMNGDTQLRRHEQNEWFYEMRVWTLILKSALEENDYDLARGSIKEVISIIGNISYVHNLWNGEIKQKQSVGLGSG
jgi:hypothetical protein